MQIAEPSETSPGRPDDHTASTVSEWWSRLARTPDTQSNMMTVDVEDYFQVEAFSTLVARSNWDRYDCRVERNVDRILEMFSSAGATATFFTLGWVAKRYPHLVRRIVAGGHELGSHGLEHRRADSQSPRELLTDLRDSKSLLEDIGSTPVKGYRAASFSVGLNNLWALQTIAEAGYRYSSSIYPIHHDLYGIPKAPRFAFNPFAGSTFLEIPVTSFRLAGMNLPCGGGGYFRLLPYWWSAFQLRRIAVAGGHPTMFYFHPWEIDAEQPKIEGAPFKTRVRHYSNLNRMERRLQRLLGQFTWRRVDAVYQL